MQMQPDMMMDNQDDQTIPPDIQDLMEEIKMAKAVKVEQLGKQVAKYRDEAVQGRKASGIEQIWDEDEEFYQGIDDNNRDTQSWLKSPSTTGGISRTPVKTTTKCTAFFNITAPFVDAATARMGDMLLPSGDKNYSIKATPVQDESQEQRPEAAPNVASAQTAISGTGTQSVGVAASQMPPASALLPAQAVSESGGGIPSPQLPQPAPKPVDPSLAIQAEADDRAECAEEQINDYLVECSYHSEVRKVIEDSAKLGTGCLKGPIPAKQVNKALGEQGLELVEKIIPTSKHVDVRDFFPDPLCGEDIHNGNYVLERDRLTARQLKQFKGTDGYLADQINKVLDEGPGGKNYSDGFRTGLKTDDSDKYEVWYFYGLVDIDQLSAMSVDVSGHTGSADSLPAVVTLVNDTAIRGFINPLDTGDFPYDLMPWQRIAGSPWGAGIARKGRTPQEMLNASARALMDNAGLSAKPQIVIRQGAIRPADGDWNLTPGKIWIATEQADVRSVADAILAITIPMVEKELQAIIQLAYKMMEDSTGITFLLQGQQGSAPDTVGGMELLNRNASSILRRMARVFDESITEPHIRRYYEWVLMYGPEKCKGDMRIEALGSSSLVEREIQAIQTAQLLNYALNPAFGLDPEKAMSEYLKAMRFIPAKLELDEAAKEAKKAQPPMIPAIEVAKINAQVREKELGARIEEDRWKTKVQAHSAMHKIEVDTDRDRVYNDSMANRDIANANARREELLLRKELAMLEYAQKRNISLDQIKADLAQTAMKLRVQRELSFVAKEPSIKSPQVAAPPTEPAGRAENGRAYEQ